GSHFRIASGRGGRAKRGAMSRYALGAQSPRLLRTPYLTSSIRSLLCPILSGAAGEAIFESVLSDSNGLRRHFRVSQVLPILPAVARCLVLRRNASGLAASF